MGLGDILNDGGVDIVSAGTQAAAPVVNLAQQGADAVAGAFSQLSQDAQQAATNTYSKVAGWLTGLGMTVQQYADDLAQLTTGQFNKYIEFVNAVDNLKSLNTEILALRSHFDGIQFKDFLSGDNKTYAMALAEKTATFLNLFNGLVKILNELIDLFGDALKDQLRSQSLPILKPLLNL